jgi:hypothetical protein
LNRGGLRQKTQLQETPCRGIFKDHQTHNDTALKLTFLFCAALCCYDLVTNLYPIQIAVFDFPPRIGLVLDHVLFS